MVVRGQPTDHAPGKPHAADAHDKSETEHDHGTDGGKVYGGVAGTIQWIYPVCDECL